MHLTSSLHAAPSNCDPQVGPASPRATWLELWAVTSTWLQSGELIRELCGATTEL